MYDKDEINAVAILYSVTGDKNDFELLLKALEPMIEKVLFRHQEMFEHWEDIKQEVWLALWQNLSCVKKLRMLFSIHIPADYFFYRIRRFVDYHSRMVRDSYDMYDESTLSIEDVRDIIYGEV